MTGTKPSNGIDLQRAKLELDQYGFTMLPNLLARDAALEMAEKLICLERLREEGEHPHQHLTSLFNHLGPEEYEMFLPLITNPIVLSLAEETLGGWPSANRVRCEMDETGHRGERPPRRRTYGLVRRTESASSREYLLSSFSAIGC